MKNYKYMTIFLFALLLVGCEKPTRSEKIEKIISKEYQSVHIDEYSQADTKIVINGTGNLASLRDDIKGAISLDFKIPFTEIKIIPSTENYFRIIGDNNLVSNIIYKNDKKILQFDFKSMVGAQENPLKLEIFSNQIEYIDNNSVNVLNLSGINKNINIQNKGFLTINLNKANYKDFLINNLGKLSVQGSGTADNLYITDFNISEYSLKNFIVTNLSLKTRGMSKGTLNVSHLTIGEVGFLSNFIITGNPSIKKAIIGISGTLTYE